MNTKLLKRVAAAILKHPDQFEMMDFFTSSLYGFSKIHRVGGCGTAACIAGWAHVLARKHKKVVKAAHRRGDTWSIAERALKISHPLSDMLFHVSRWPREFRDRYDDGGTPLQRARAAADRISHFIKTKGAE